MLNAPKILARVEELTGGTAAPHLNVGDVKRFDIPLPPLAEQAGIVAKVDHLLALCDTLEAKLRAADEGARRLAESLVAELIA